METIFWEVKYYSPPKTIHYCKKCGIKTEHRSSDLFRVNNQKKSLDVWLIYRCVHCKTTWNLTVYSRINTDSISRSLLHRLLSNDPALAQTYAMDTTLLKKNGADTDTPSYCIVGDAIDFTENIQLKISSDYPSKVKVSKIIREKLSLSNKDFDDMVSDGRIRMADGTDINKCRLQKEIIVLVSKCL